MKTVAIIGPGQMGSGISQVCALSGYEVLLLGRDRDRSEAAKAKVGTMLSRLVEKEKLSSEEREAALQRILPTDDFESIASAGLVVESVAEKEDVKAEILNACGRFLAEDALLATNTSSISITRLARNTPDPARFLGLHFFNPAPLMALVEVVSGLATSKDSVTRASAFAASLGKTPVHVTDSPGFVVNRLLIPMLNEAVFALAEGVANIESIDTAVKLGLNHPMGPLALADLIGLDTCLEICRVLYAGTGDQKFRPAPLLINYVEAGWLGRKAGRGFYDYSGPEPVPTR